MKIAFRVDASTKIGTGHVMRCITLAEALVNTEAQIHFICRHLPESLANLLGDKGFGVSILSPGQASIEEFPLAHSEWLGVSQEFDSKATINIIQNMDCDWLIIDHYAIDARWESLLRPYVKNIMVLDDLADRQHDCDVLLDQNLYLDQEVRYESKLPKYCTTLLGPRYALLRKEFTEARNNTKLRGEKVSRVLVFFGGVDANDFTTKTILALSQIAKQKFTVDVVIGDQHPNKVEIAALCQRLSYSCHVQTSKIAELMASADFSIGAGGGAVWERACLKLPTLSIPIAKHQVKQLLDIAIKGVTYTFDAEDYTLEKIKCHVSLLMENSSLRHLLSINSAEIVDGNGTYRVAQQLQADKEIHMRQADEADEKSLFEWRNHRNIQKVSLNQDEITWYQHQTWFSAMLSNNNRVLLIGEYKDTPIGVVRFDLQADSAEISIYLVQQNDSRGLGISLLKSAEKWISEYRSEIKKLKANVLESNHLSQSFFKKAGYKLVTKMYSKEL